MEQLNQTIKHQQQKEKMRQDERTPPSDLREIVSGLRNSHHPGASLSILSVWQYDDIMRAWCDGHVRPLRVGVLSSCCCVGWNVRFGW